MMFNILKLLEIFYISDRFEVSLMRLFSPRAIPGLVNTQPSSP